MTAASNVSGNYFYKKAWLFARQQITDGYPLYSSLLPSLYPQTVIQFIKIGEESGSLDTMLNKLVSLYTEEIHQFVVQLSSLLEPVIMLILSIIIGGLIIAMYLPIFKLGSVIA